MLSNVKAGRSTGLVVKHRLLLFIANGSFQSQPLVGARFLVSGSTNGFSLNAALVCNSGDARIDFESTFSEIGLEPNLAWEAGHRYVLVKWCKKDGSQKVLFFYIQTSCSQPPYERSVNETVLCRELRASFALTRWKWHA